MRKQLNEWYIFCLTYYWPECGKTMSLPICEVYLFNTGLFPIISTLLTSTGDPLLEWLHLL